MKLYDRLGVSSLNRMDERESLPIKGSDIVPTDSFDNLVETVNTATNLPDLGVASLPDLGLGGGSTVGGGITGGGGNAGVGYTGGSDNSSVVNAQAEAALQAKRKAEREAELQALKDARYQEYLDLIGQVSTLDWDYGGDQDAIQTTIDRLKTLYGEFGAYTPDWNDKGSFEIFGNMPQQYYSILGLNMDGTPKTPEESGGTGTSQPDLSDYLFVVGDPTNPGPGVVVRDPETGEFPPGYVQGEVDGPAGTITPEQVLGTENTGTGGTGTGGTETVFSEPEETIVGGGGSASDTTITPNTSVPETSTSGLAGYFTTPQVNQIVNPGYSQQPTTDMDKLLQMQAQTYGNFLYNNTPTTAATTGTTGTAPSEGDAGSGAGYVGGGYNVPSGMNPGITDLYNNPTGIQFGDLQNQMFMDPFMYNNPGGFYTGYNPKNDMQQGVLNNIYNRGYGLMDFPVFSGITSLVPEDTRKTIGR